MVYYCYNECVHYFVIIKKLNMCNYCYFLVVLKNRKINQGNPIRNGTVHLKLVAPLLTYIIVYDFIVSYLCILICFIFLMIPKTPIAVMPAKKLHF